MEDLEWNDVHSEPIRGWLVPYVTQVCGIYLSFSFVVLHLLSRKPDSINLLFIICERFNHKYVGLIFTCAYRIS